jgi:WD40 repeat protein
MRAVRRSFLLILAAAWLLPAPPVSGAAAGSRLGGTKVVAVLQATTANMEDAQFSPNGQYIAASQNDVTLWVWDWRHRRRLVGLSTGDGFPETYAWSPNGADLAIVNRNGRVFVYDWRRRKLLGSWQTAGTTSDLEFSPDGKAIATADDDIVHVRDWSSRRLLATLKLPDVADTATFLPGGTQLVTSSDDGAARVWDWRHHRALAALRTPASTYQEVASVSGNGRYLAIDSVPKAGANESDVEIWDLRKRHLLITLRNQSLAGNGALSPDGASILLRGGQTADRLWDWRPGRILATFANGNAQYGIYTARFSADGRYVATASGDGKAIIFVWR